MLKKICQAILSLLVTTAGFGVLVSHVMAADVIWVDDAVPAGAASLAGSGDVWNWVSASPAPYTGRLAHQSTNTAGLHEHYFNGASTTITPAVGESLYTYVYLDAVNTPSEIMLHWYDGGSWEHRAYWGANTVTYGVSGSASRYNMGALPAAGQWVRLEIPAGAVGLEGKTISGMCFTQFNGRATWDNSGVATKDVVWIDDAIPAGANASAASGDAWNWVSSPSPVSGTLVHQSNTVAGLHEHFFSGSSTTLNPTVGDSIYTYVYLDPANTPTEIMLHWNDGSSWEHRAYWGANTITYGTGGSASRFYMGPLPAAGQWVKLEVPASAVALEGKSINGMCFSQVDGRASWDKTGKAATTAGLALPTLSAPPVATLPVVVAPIVATPVTTTSTPVITATTSTPVVTTTTSTPTTTTSTPTVTTSVETLVTDSVADFSSTQGKNGWSYGDFYGDSSALVAFSNYAAASWTGPFPTLAVSASTQCPSADGIVKVSAVRRWTSTIDGSVHVVGTFKIGHNGDGVAVWVLVGGKEVVKRTYVGNSSTISSLPVDFIVSVHKGDAIDFAVDPGSGRDINGDTTTVTAQISVTGSASTVTGGSGSTTTTSTPVTTTTSTPVTTTTSVPVTVTVSIPVSTTSAADTVWFDDALPTGASGQGAGGDTWSWVTSSPTALSGTSAHQSISSAGLHEHYFNGASLPLTPSTGNYLFTYVYLDPVNTPTEVMVHWYDGGSWEHRAYWGANAITYGVDNSASRHYAGTLPSAGGWVRLEVSASSVGLEGQAITGMCFSEYNGRATWDKSGKSLSGSSAATTTSTVSTPVTTTTSTPTLTSSYVTSGSALDVSEVDDLGLHIPLPGDHILHVLTPTLLEVRRINTKASTSSPVDSWNLISGGTFNAPSTGAFVVKANGQTIAVTSVGMKRRALSAPLYVRDLRIDNSLFLQLASPISDGQAITVTNPDASLWDSSMVFSATASALRFSPAIHVNQEGYVPNLPKKAMVGYFLGSMGEMSVPAGNGFQIVNASSGAVVFSGALTVRADYGYPNSPAPYQKVYQADFSSYTTPGEYQLVVPGMGASLPFLINDGIAMAWARTYELGIYHQRCGTTNAMPYTRFVHDACHTGAAEIPSPQANYQFTWTTIASKNGDYQSNPLDIAPQLKDEASQMYPYVNKGTVDVAGGHHDAGDYSKYTTNCANLVALLTFTADSIKGGDVDNLGVPESGDGIPDILQEAKWEADYIAKLQDADGGFYFIVYPKNREYEGNVLPDQGDSQVVWPKNTSATAACVAALSQIASSPTFKRYYPAAAATYMQKATLGWKFLMNAINKYGKDGSYQKVTFYSDNFSHNDELAWAACQMFLATGDTQYSQKLYQWFPDPSDSNTFRWGWWRLSECWGNAIRSYAFAARSGRLSAGQLDATYLAKCEAQVKLAGDDALTWSTQNAYGTSFPYETKRVLSAGWYFSLDQASDMAAAYQLNPRPEYIDALVANMNYEGGSNPVNVTYVTGLGTKRQHEIVNQYSQNDRRVLPVDGVPLGNVQTTFDFLPLYGSELGDLNFPSDAGGNMPFYDRWADTHNVTTEFITLNQARSLMSSVCLAAQTSSISTAWKSAGAQISAPTGIVGVGSPVTLSVSVPGLDITNARIVWEARDQDPSFGSTYTISPKNNGDQWVEVEVTTPDGRRAFGTATFTANSPVVTWMDDATPLGASLGTGGGDAWNWMTASPAPYSGKKYNQSSISAGLHEHYFSGASATMDVGAGDKMFCWVYLDPANPPSEIMLHWYDGKSWEHRAYWGNDSISYGTANSAGRYHVAALPAVGQWVKLQVPASAVGLEGSTLTGMCFSTFGGRVSYDATGREQ